MTKPDSITPQDFDEMVAKPSRGRVLWGADVIGRRIGVSRDFVRERLAKEPGSPVKKVCGRWCAVESELLAYLSRV